MILIFYVIKGKQNIGATYKTVKVKEKGYKLAYTITQYGEYAAHS